MTEGPAAHARVLVVDDSAFARKVLREAIGTSPSLEVVGTATDGLEALEKIAALDPDVVTLDLMMPNLDGLGVLRELRALGKRTRVVLVSISDEESEVVVEALQLGALGLVRKPTALAIDRLYELSGELVETVERVAAMRASIAPRPPRAHVAPPLRAGASGAVDLVVIGTSAGGPQALTTLLAALPADLPAPVAIALHIPVDYTPALARRLDQSSPLHVVEAHDGLTLKPGLAVLAKGGTHLLVERAGDRLVAKLSATPPMPHAPSVDVLFASAARACGRRVLGVVLTGMGDDGVAGAREIRGAGGTVITEDESSCIVYGMPRAIAEAGLSDGSATLEEMSHAIVERV